MGSRPAKQEPAAKPSSDNAGANAGGGGGGNGIEGRSAAQQETPSPAGQQAAGDSQALQASVQRMESQVAALKEELNHEIEVNSELRTEAARHKQTSYLALATAVVGAALTLYLFSRRQAGHHGPPAHHIQLRR